MVSVHGVDSVQWGGLCPGSGLCPGGGWSLSRRGVVPVQGVSVQGVSVQEVSAQVEGVGLCPGGLCLEGLSLSGGSLSEEEAFSVRETPVRLRAGGMHPTELHSCFFDLFRFV